MRIGKSTRMALGVSLGLALLLAFAVACSAEEPAQAPTPAEPAMSAADIAKIVQETMSAQPQPETMSPSDVAQAMQDAMAGQEGVSQQDVADAIASALAAQPKEEGLTEADVARTIAEALQAQTPGLTEADVAKTVADALAAQSPGMTEADVAAAVAEAMAQQAPGLTQEDLAKAVAEAMASEVAVPTLLKEGEGQTVDITTKPAYGGQIRLALHSDPGGEWDMCQFKAQHMQTHVVENFLLGDYNLGPSGEGLTTFQPRLGIGTDKLAVGALAESWEVPDPLTYSFKLRTGIRWQDKHPTFGRPVTAEEIATEINRIKECRWPRHDFLDDVTADDTDGDGVADTITHHTNQPISFWGYEFAWGPYFMSAPPESVEAGLDEPWNQSGTGPWMTVEGGYTPASTLEFEKNPDWHMTHTVDGTEYRLPFLDGMHYTIIPQEAVRLTALRTGKLDYLQDVRTSDRPILEQTNPDLGKALALDDSFGYFMPMNKPPFDDVNVRLAMNYALDRDVYTDALFGGDAILLTFPLQPEWPIHYEALEDQPQSVQDYHTYDPEKAMQLLDEAGLTPNADGVRLSIPLLIRNTNQLELEAAEISVGFWKDIGVDVTLDLVDGPVLQSRLFEKQYEFFANNVTGRPNALNDFRRGHQWNRSNLNDEEFLELWENVLVATDPDEQVAAIKIATTKYLELAPSAHTPAGFSGDYWHPWVQNHSGENVLAFVDYASKWAYVWLDRDRRFERTGFR